MSLYGLVHPFPEKCESLNWRWVHSAQLVPQGLGPVMKTTPQCDFGDIAPYKNPQVIRELAATMPFRIWGYPNVTQCGRMAPLLYYRRPDPNPTYKSCGGRGTNPATGCPYTNNPNRGQCSCGSDNPSWPYTFS